MYPEVSSEGQKERTRLLNPIRPDQVTDQFLIHFFCLLAIGILAGLIAGSYPAFYLSSFNPVKVLKGIKIKSAASVIFIRKGLVITQFTVSIILIISTVIIYQQVQHIKNRNIGYNKNNLLYMDMRGGMKEHFNAIKHDLVSTGYVENAAASLHSWSCFAATTPQRS